MCNLEEIFNISKKAVVVTGASGFFGRYIARAFLEVGANVILLSRKHRLFEQIESYRKEFGKARVSGFRVNFYKRKELKSLLKKIARKFDIDILVNNAYDLSEKTGFNTPSGCLEKITFSHWKAAFESGIYWPALTTQIFGEKMKRKRRGSIINISSMYGIIVPSPKLYKDTRFLNPPTYCVNKAGIISLTRYTASFWGKYGLRCNAVLPGPFPNVETKGSNSVNSSNFFLQRLKKNTVLNRVGHPNDLRGILIYLASDSSSFMTGQTIVIDGGWSIV